MGNTISYIGSHGKRLLNRYNAQFRALKFIERDKLPNAPRHSSPLSVEDPIVYEHLQNKDPSLDKYLKDVFIKSYDKEPLVKTQKNSKRPLPTYSEGATKNAFQEPVEMIKGLCTLSQFFEFRNAHDNDPVENSATVIAKNYSLDVTKVENLLKYYSVFRVYEMPKEETEANTEKDMTIDEFVEKLKELNEANPKKEIKEKESKDKTEKESLQLESREAKN